MAGIAALHDINRRALQAKLSKCKKTLTGEYRCNDIIEALSEGKVRDKRLINDYAADEVTIRNVNVQGVLRKCRMFTAKGLIRYIHEGKIYSYKNVCEYFSVVPKDEMLEDFIEQKILDHGVLHKKPLLKWLYEKRKSIASMSIVLSKEEAIVWMTDFAVDDDVNQKKLAWLMSYLRGNLDTVS